MNPEPEYGSIPTFVRVNRRVTPGPGVHRTSEEVRPEPVVPVVVKIGGRSLEAPGAPEELAAEVASLSGEVLVVHGGGREVSDWSDRLGIQSRFVDGLRVTDAGSLEVAVAVLAGLANKRLVAVLRDSGVDAVGLSALDGGIAQVRLHPAHATLGSVGVVESVDPRLIRMLLAEGKTPVLASIGAIAGELVNLNADELAASLAAALGANTLVLLSDAKGLELDGALVPSLDAGGLESALKHRDVRDGMIAKLRASQKAIEAGVGRVRIAAWSGRGTLASLLSAGGSGTTVTAR